MTNNTFTKHYIKPNNIYSSSLRKMDLKASKYRGFVKKEHKNSVEQFAKGYHEKRLLQIQWTDGHQISIYH